jgi:hypothetical protein
VRVGCWEIVAVGVEVGVIVAVELGRRVQEGLGVSVMVGDGVLEGRGDTVDVFSSKPKKVVGVGVRN